MRTTITLDPDVEVLLKNAMREQDSSFKRVLNDALRRGLSPAVPQGRVPFVQLTFASGRQLVDLTKANTLAGEIEDQELVTKLQSGR